MANNSVSYLVLLLLIFVLAISESAPVQYCDRVTNLYHEKCDEKQCTEHCKTNEKAESGYCLVVEKQQLSICSFDCAKYKPSTPAPPPPPPKLFYSGSWLQAKVENVMLPGQKNMNCTQCPK
ncbi:putative knottin, scorpion toxin-like superfamily [Helianthus annuus]|nr:putative knottin, scorpion toxin-like superfamily [Helianthus annuus]KAJ0834555.1 putative knottin, scorpion toxin-like superfamily [Helianthus annuus]